MSLGLRSKRIEIPFRLGNLADAVETTQSLGGLTTVAPSIFPGPSRTFQESGQSLPIWRSQRPLHTAIGARSGEKHLSCSRHWRFPEVSQKVLKCFEIRIVFPFFLCFSVFLWFDAGCPSDSFDIIWQDCNSAKTSSSLQNLHRSAPARKVCREHTRNSECCLCDTVIWMRWMWWIWTYIYT